MFATFWLGATFSVAADKPFLLHLPGIGGHMRIDDAVTDGMLRGGVDEQVRIYDWTNGNPGLPALGGYDRNRAEAKKIAEVLIDMARTYPNRPIVITSHSGCAAVSATPASISASAVHSTLRRPSLPARWPIHAELNVPTR